MLLEEAESVFMAFILCVSDILGRQICVFKGSTVDLPCSPQHNSSSVEWFTLSWDGYNFRLDRLPADGKRRTWNMSGENHPTLTIRDVREGDENYYCCSSNTTDLCWRNRIRLRVTDLQVKVIPSSKGQTVTLMCSNSCPLPETPVVYKWYKNGEFLYEDWSHWYQELVNIDEVVRYSCAVKGYEDLRAPEVSVDSVSSTCFSVTYTKGRMCSSNQSSVDEPCSITHPREVYIERTYRENKIMWTCQTSCPIIDSQTTYMWYRHRVRTSHTKKVLISHPSDGGFSCAVKDQISAEVCSDGKNCWSVNYVSRRICALQGSTVDISSEYTFHNNESPTSKSWYKIRRNEMMEIEEVLQPGGQVQYLDVMNKSHILRIHNLKKNDSAQYVFTLWGYYPLLENHEILKYQEFLEYLEDLPEGSYACTLVVTDLKVRFTPSAEVNEGKRVTLTCSTSCPLTDNTSYTWSLNGRPLTLPENQLKHLTIDPVSSQHAGNYSCSVTTGSNEIMSGEETLTVQRDELVLAVIFGFRASLPLILLALAAFLRMREKRNHRPISLN